MRLLTDTGLANRAALGDGAAFAEVFRRHHQAIYRFCRSMLVDPEDASDALQNTMAAALRALPGERRRIDLRPWLFRVARNECVTLLRTRRPALALDEVEVMGSAGAEETAAIRARLGELVADLQALPERQRSALVMRELSGLDYGEIALALETTAATAKQAVYEARTALHELAEGRALSCEAIRRTISDGDGRSRRGRRVRSHLRACPACDAFALAIGQRRADLALLAPPLPAALAVGILPGLVGAKAGGSGGALAGGAAATGALGTVKGTALLAATVAIGAGGYGALVQPMAQDGDRRPAATSDPPPAHRAPGTSAPAGRAPAARRGDPAPARRPDRRDPGGRAGRDPAHVGVPAPTRPAERPVPGGPGADGDARKPEEAGRPEHRPRPVERRLGAGAPARPAPGTPRSHTPAPAAPDGPRGDRSRPAASLPTLPSGAPAGVGAAPTGPTTTPTAPDPRVESPSGIGEPAPTLPAPPRDH